MQKKAFKSLENCFLRDSLKRPLVSYFKVQRLIASCIRGKPWAVNWNAIQNKKLLNIGCGLKTHKNFINLDYGWHPGVDLCRDITRGIPIKSNSLEGIFTEHCLEHISVDYIIPILGECLRVLRPRGTIRIIMPDGELYLKGYASLLTESDAAALPYAQRDELDGIYSPIISVNRIFRAEGHQFIYDFDYLRKLLEKTGFEDIRKVSFGQGRDSRLLIDSPSRVIESFYVEAAKPC